MQQERTINRNGKLLKGKIKLCVKEWNSWIAIHFSFASPCSLSQNTNKCLYFLEFKTVLVCRFSRLDSLWQPISIPITVAYKPLCPSSLFENLTINSPHYVKSHIFCLSHVILFQSAHVPTCTFLTTWYNKEINLAIDKLLRICKELR